MGKTHKEQSQLRLELDKAKTQVKVGAEYRHYKTLDKAYKVLGLAFQEENDEICVVYRAEYGERITFVRPLVSWLQYVEWNGDKMPRFIQQP